MPHVQAQNDAERLGAETQTEPFDENEPEDTETPDSASESGDETQDNADIQSGVSENEAESENEGDEDAGANTVASKETEGNTQSGATGNLAARRLPYARAGEPYDWDRCTIVVTLQITPQRAGQDAAARKVFLSARTHADPPQSASMRWSELESRLPEEIKTLLMRVRQNLPERAAQHAAEEEAERRRQQELKAQSEKRAAEKKSKGQINVPAPRTAKRKSKIDLNAPPALPASQAGAATNFTAAASAGNETVQPTAVKPKPAVTVPEATTPQSQMSLF